MSGRDDRTRVVVTGAGVVTPLGDRPADLHAALCAGRSALQPLTGFDDRELPPTLGGEPEGNLRPLDRTALLCASAAALALEASGWDAERVAAHEVGLVLGTMFGSMRTISEFDRRAVVDGPSYAKPMHFANTVINAAAGQTAIWHRLTGVNATISGGTVSSVQAIGYAADLIRQGRATALLAGGAEELCFETVYGFLKAGLLGGAAEGAPPRPTPLDRRRNGFALGESAALVMLEDARSAEARGATILGEITGYAGGYDPSRGRDPESGAGAVARALGSALAEAGLEPGRIDAAVLSANGSVDGDRTEARGLRAIWNGSGDALPVTAPKSMLGESLGAAGALQLVVLLEAMRSGRLPGIHGLEELDDEIGLGGASPASLDLEMERGLVVATGLDGKASALIAEACS